MGEEKLSFPISKSGKRQKVHLGRSVSTHFVADCGYDSRLKRNRKQCLCKILEGKQGALWEMWKWRMS